MGRKISDAVDRETVLRLAGRASVDPQTAEKFLLGRPGGWPKGITLHRLELAAKELGIVVQKGGGK